MSRTEGAGETRAAILDAARLRLLADGHAALSTRRVAETAGVPLSQLHYHFGSKQGLLLALLEDENRRRLERQADMYASDRPLWQRYEQACDYLEDDLESGYVRVLQEMIVTGWANAEIGAEVRRMLLGWFDLLTGVAREVAGSDGSVGPFTAEEVASLIGSAFIGAEALILLGFDRGEMPVRAGLRRVGVVIRRLEENRGEVRRASTGA